MEIKEKQIVKDNQILTIRSFQENDAPFTVAYKLEISKTTIFMNRFPDEVNQDIEKEQKGIEMMLQSPTNAYVGLFLNNNIIASFGLYIVNNVQKIKHRCSIGVSVNANYRHQGYGKILLKEVISIAKEIGYEQIELEVISSNIAGIKLYESVGFKKVGTIPHAYKINNEYYDFDFMVLSLI